MANLDQSIFQRFLIDTIWPIPICDWGYVDDDRAVSFQHLLNWLERGDQGPLSYLSDHRGGLREKITYYYPEFKAGLVFLFDYGHGPFSISKAGPNLASYVLNVQGRDYHLILKHALNQIGHFLQAQCPDLKFVHSLDIHPVLERDLAYRAGLGWFGKNSMLIHTKKGSKFIIASLLLNQSLNFPKQQCETDHCGTCRACIEACPTQAIDASTRTLKAQRCISTFTIELFKDAPAPLGYKNSEQWIFGCDICQNVCPWNKQKAHFKQTTLTEQQENLKQFFLDRTIEQTITELEGMSNKAFERKFKETSLARTGRVGVLKNLKAYL